MVTERLKSRQKEEQRSRSIEKSYERYRDQSFDNNKEARSMLDYSPAMYSNMGGGHASRV